MSQRMLFKALNILQKTALADYIFIDGWQHLYLYIATHMAKSLKYKIKEENQPLANENEKITSTTVAFLLERRTPEQVIELKYTKLKNTQRSRIF